jgi:hypothetical protein
LLYNIRYGLGLGAALHWPFPGVGYVIGNRRNLQRIIDFIKSEDPDIVGLIEVDTGSRPGWIPILRAGPPNPETGS